MKLFVHVFSPGKRIMVWAGALLLLLALSVGAGAQSTLVCGATSAEIPYSGSYTSYLLPSNAQTLTLRVVGGDGGYARIENIDPISGLLDNVCVSPGGEGATMEAVFSVGRGTGEIPPGSTLRFIVGGKGGSRDISITEGTNIAYGAGGGGSAVLFKAPGATSWEILIVAGGGGGAFQGMFASDCVDSEPGQGGRASTSGGSGNGDLDAGYGGYGGSGGGTGSAFGGGGGGADTDGGGILGCGGGHSGYNNGGAGGDSCTGEGVSGGFGFGGGGGAFGTGGGGGGYSGGGGGGTTGRGGGGGSYINPTYIESTLETKAGGLVSDPQNGMIAFSLDCCDAPIARCKQDDIAVALDAQGLAFITPELLNSNSSAECGPLELSVNIEQLDCYAIGMFIPITLTVTDAVGQTATCVKQVTVYDDTAPSARCNPVTVQLDQHGFGSITVYDIDNNSFDACGIASRTISRTNFSCADVQPTYRRRLSFTSVTLSLTDVNGNSSFCVARVNVVDATPPQARCRDITIALPQENRYNLRSSEIDNGSWDVCSMSLSLSKSVFTCNDLGPNQVVLTARDQSNNRATCTAVVTVTQGESSCASSPDNLEAQVARATVDSPAITLYPNPVADEVTIDLPALPLTGSQLAVVDIYGRTVVKRTQLSERVQLSLGHLPAGAYFLRLQLASGEVRVRRLLVQP